MSPTLTQAFDLTVGASIDRYEIVCHLGVGAMGTVYLAYDPTLDREVAIKLLRAEFLERKDLVTRFRREAKAVAKINHRHVVQIFDTGEHDGSPYFVMEYLEGIDCGRLGKDYGPLPEAVVAAIGRDAAEGLAAAADAGVIHRDVKPANLVATTPGPIKVTDFGLAKTRLAASLSAAGELTIQGATLGTPDYMSPEQAVGSELDVNTDIYSLGATLFALLSGRPPFRSLDEEVGNMEVITRHVTTTPPDLASLVPDANAALVATITQMMARAPKDRPTYETILQGLSPLAETLDGSPLAVLRSRPTRPPMASDGDDSPVSSRKEGVSTADDPDDSNEASLITALAASPRASMTGGLQVPRLIPRWALMITGISLVIFGASLLAFALIRPGVRLRFWRGEDVHPARSTKPSPKDFGVDRGIRVPEGFVLMTLPDGERLLVSKHALSRQRARAILGKKRLPRGGDIPVRGLSLVEAKRIARVSGGRLPTAEEWPSLVAHREIVLVKGACEWVDGTSVAKAPDSKPDHRSPHPRCFRRLRVVPRISATRRYRDSVFRIVLTDLQHVKDRKRDL